MLTRRSTAPSGLRSREQPLRSPGLARVEGDGLGLVYDAVKLAQRVQSAVLEVLGRAGEDEQEDFERVAKLGAGDVLVAHAPTPCDGPAPGA